MPINSNCFTISSISPSSFFYCNCAFEDSPYDKFDTICSYTFYVYTLLSKLSYTDVLFYILFFGYVMGSLIYGYY